MTKVSAIVLGAGLSRRMGEENKLFLPFKGRPMIDWVLHNVINSEVDEIIVVGSQLSMDELSSWKSDRVRLVENIDYESGMTSSIQAGVRASQADGYMICLGDQPKIKTHTYNQILTAFSTSNPTNSEVIAVPFYDKKKGNPVVFSKAYRQLILTHQEPEGCKTIIQQYSKMITSISIEDPGILQDIDTKEDYQKLN